MKLLFDQNLSHKLIAAVRLLCPGSTHVRPAGLDHADNESICQYALEHGFTIVSRDSDFLERALARGTPPAVICLRLGNTSTKTMGEVLLRNLPSIIASAADDPPPHVWEIEDV